MSDAIVVDPRDAEANKSMAILSYLGFLALIPLLSARDSPFVRFHLNQSFVLFSLALVCSVPSTCVICGVGLVPFVGVLVSSLLSFVFLGVLFTMMGLGIANAAKLRTEKLPVIGDLFVVLR